MVEIGGFVGPFSDCNIYIRAMGDDLCCMYIRNDMTIGESK